MWPRGGRYLPIAGFCLPAGRSAIYACEDTDVCRDRIEVPTQSNGMDSSSPWRLMGARLNLRDSRGEKESTMNELMRIGVDLAKNVFQVHGVDRQERAAWCKRLPRDRWLQAVTEVAPPGCEIGMQVVNRSHSPHRGRTATRMVASPRPATPGAQRPGSVKGHGNSRSNTRF